MVLLSIVCMSSVLELHSILSYCVSFAKDSIAASNIAKSLLIDCVIFARGIDWILPSDPIVALAPPPSILTYVLQVCNCLFCVGSLQRFCVPF